MAVLSERCGRRGAVMVEMALTLLLLLLLTLGLIEYGWLFLMQHKTANAARRGARIAILPFSTNDKVLTAIAAEMERAGIIDSGYSVTLSPADISLPYPSEIISVEITVPYQNVALTQASLVPVPTNLHASVSMAKEGP